MGRFPPFETFQGDYHHQVVARGGGPDPVGGHDPFDNERPLRTSAGVRGGVADEVLLGIGAQIAVRAHIMQTVFIGEPQEDVWSYCVLC